MRIMLGFILFVSILARRQGGAPEIAPQDFKRLHDLIRPQAGESPWRDIEWMTSIRGARERAAQEGKPLLIFTAADGSPLART